MFNNYFSAIILICCALASLASNPLTPIIAIANIKSPHRTHDQSQVEGNITFTEFTCGAKVRVHVHLTGLTPGRHAFHVHEKGDLSDGCLATGGHYNPHKMAHGAPPSFFRHVGDLGNIVADENGIVNASFTDPILSLSGKHTIIGRSVVILAGDGDLELGNASETKQNGHVGERIACGVVGLNMDVVEWPCQRDASSPTVGPWTLLTFVLTVLISRVF